MRCKHCERELPNKNWKTSDGKCIWCDSKLALIVKINEEKE